MDFPKYCRFLVRVKVRTLRKRKYRPTVIREVFWDGTKFRYWEGSKNSFSVFEFHADDVVSWCLIPDGLCTQEDLKEY